MPRVSKGPTWACGRCGAGIIYQPPFGKNDGGKGNRAKDYHDPKNWKHHPRYYVVRDAHNCVDPPDVTRRRPEPKSEPKPSQDFWEEVLGEAPKRKRPPPAGSPAARRLGCCCPRGMSRSKWLSAACRLHGISKDQ